MDKSFIILEKEVVHVMNKGHEIVFIDFLNVDIQFLVRQGQQNPPVFLDGPRMDVEMVADVAIAPRCIDHGDPQGSVLETNGPVNRQAEIDSLLF